MDGWMDGGAALEGRGGHLEVGVCAQPWLSSLGGKSESDAKLSGRPQLGAGACSFQSW